MAGKNYTSLLKLVEDARKKLGEAKASLAQVIADSSNFDGEMQRRVPLETNPAIEYINEIEQAIMTLSDTIYNLGKVGENAEATVNNDNLGEAPAPLEQSAPQEQLQQGYVRAENGKQYFRG